jgi:predicted MFS family arabinose efflux permease
MRMSKATAVHPVNTASKLDEFRNGWPILLACLLGCGLGVSSLPLYTAGTFMPKLQTQFGWSRGELSTAILIFTLTLAAASPVVGRLVDRIGVRRAAASSIIAASVCYLALGTHLSSLWGYYALHATIAALGAAAAPVAYTRIITAHFHQSKGLALGITLLGPSLAATFAPAAFSQIIAQAGWASGYIALAGLTAAMLPLLMLIKAVDSRNSDGGTATTVQSNHDPAQRKTIFFTLLCGLALFSLGIGGLIVHLVPMLIDAGMEPLKASSIAGLIGISGIVGRLVGGALADRIFAPYVLIGVATAAAVGCTLLALVGASAAVPAALAIGFSLGAEADLMGYLVARYFGSRSYGKVFGWQYAAFIAGIGLSPLMLGKFHDATGSYSSALGICTLLLTGSIVAFANLPKFKTHA